MNDMTRILAALGFVIVWYALILIGRALFKPFEKLKLVWCPAIRSISFVEVAATSKLRGAPVSVQRCLLWPEYQGCGERCIKSHQRR